MRVIVQRAKHASCIIDEKVLSSIDKGYMLLVGFTHNDNIDDVKYLAKKVVNLRIFEDENGKMNKSILDVGGSILSISQFTLYGDARKGNRPSFVNALRPDEATILYDEFNKELSAYNVEVGTGKFGAEMAIDFVNDGPVTIILESKN